MKIHGMDVQFAPNIPASLATILLFSLGWQYGLIFLAFMIVVTYASILLIRHTHIIEKRELRPFSFPDERTGKHIPAIIEVGKDSKKRKVIMKIKEAPAASPDEAVATARSVIYYGFEKRHLKGSAS